MAEADLAGFLEAAGRSLADAQQNLTGAEAGVPRSMAISEADLEVKAALSRVDGDVRLEPISTADLRRTSLDPGLVSTVRIHYVAVSPEPLPGGVEPTRPAPEVIGEVRGRPDVAALERILGRLTFEAVFLPHTARWVVTARDSEDRLVREAIVPDVERRE